MWFDREFDRTSGSFVPHPCDLLVARVQRVDGALHGNASACNSHTHHSHACMHDARCVVNSQNSKGDRAGRGRGNCVPGGTNALSTINLGQVGCPAEEKLASLQLAPGKLHVEAWAGRDERPSLGISRRVEIGTGCARDKAEKRKQLCRSATVSSLCTDQQDERERDSRLDRL